MRRNTHGRVVRSQPAEPTELSLAVDDRSKSTEAERLLSRGALKVESESLPSPTWLGRQVQGLAPAAIETKTADASAFITRENVLIVIMERDRRGPRPRSPRVEHVEENVRRHRPDNRSNARCTSQFSTPIKGTIKIEQTDLRIELQPIDLAAAVKSVLSLLRAVFLLTAKSEICRIRLRGRNLLQVGKVGTAPQYAFGIHHPAEQTAPEACIRRKRSAVGIGSL